MICSLTFPHVLRRTVWHAKGDFFATLADNVQTASQVMIHSLSQASSTKPFSRNRGIVKDCTFHPGRPLFLIATEQKVFVYNL